MPDLLSAELSVVAFQRRVLALAENPATPLRERLRFIGIVSSNIDEFYMVRMPRLRAAALTPMLALPPDDDGMSTATRLARVEQAMAELLAAESRCASSCLASVRALGTQILGWDELTDAERSELRDWCRAELYPDLTPLAMTLSPGHPLPHLAHLGLSLAVIFRHDVEDLPHLAEIELPASVPRMVGVAGRAQSVVMLEEVLRANLDLIHPHTNIVSAHLFRVTRAGELDLDEEASDDLLASVADAAQRRANNTAVRVEIESETPRFAVELILESLRRDAVANERPMAIDHVQFVDTLLDLRCLSQLPLPDDPSLDYVPIAATISDELAGSVFDRIRDGDLLMHHPFDSFDDTVVRFLREAADDPSVTTVKITLYRVGETSPVVEALIDAARGGKRVVAFVELKARFDEQHNVNWTRALERAGAHIVYGIVGLKTHAKLALVIRREESGLRRYVHVSTGNYNVRSGRQYTDLSLFSARDDLAADIGDLFNELTSAARAPQGLSHGALVAPNQLLPSILELIRRETRNAAAGLAAAITIKVNGLSDAEVIRALYDASNAGVPIDLIVRGICTLKPGVVGMSENIRVVSVVGRLLEHSRIYRFGGNDSPDYFIGSSDLRPRNLRRRVELLAPVIDLMHRETLDYLLGLYMSDGCAWELAADGSYSQRCTGMPQAQDALAELSRR